MEGRWVDLVLTFLSVAVYGVVVSTSFIAWRRSDGAGVTYRIVAGWFLSFALLLCGVALLMVEAVG